jgi:stage II sporulation protein D
MSSRPRLLLACLAAAAPLLPAAAPPVAAASTAQVYPVPAGGRYTLHGHGFGHGHGMSQYGAAGAAVHGLGYRGILRFYYPRTSPGTAAGRLRVLVTSDTTPDLAVSAVPGLVVHDLGSRSTYHLPRIAGVSRWRLSAAGDRTVIGYFTKGWHRYRPGGRPWSATASSGPAARSRCGPPRVGAPIAAGCAPPRRPRGRAPDAP